MAKIKLFQPIKIGELELKNRVVMAPMCMFEVKDKDGMVTDFHKVHYAARALGGVGLINLEATAVEPDGRISPFDLGLWNEEQAEKLKELIALIHQFGSKVGIQLGHAGRKAKGVKEPIAPSALRFSEDYEQPLEMSQSRIAGVIEEFQKAAQYAALAGVDMIEIHAAHGYLLNQFLSPISNQRQDEYGGNLKKRYRILSEVVEAVRKVFSGPLWVRISADEYSQNGSTMTDFIQICKWLKEQGVDLIDVSSGGVTEQSPTHLYPGYQVPLAMAIKSGTDIPVAAVGLLNDPKLAEYILQSGQADLICLGRPLLSNPNWLQMAARILAANEEFQAYNNAYERGRTI